MEILYVVWFLECFLVNWSVDLIGFFDFVVEFYEVFCVGCCCRCGDGKEGNLSCFVGIGWFGIVGSVSDYYGFRVYVCWGDCYLRRLNCCCW